MIRGKLILWRGNRKTWGHLPIGGRYKEEVVRKEMESKIVRID